MNQHYLLKRRELELRIQTHKHAIELEKAKLACTQLELERLNIDNRFEEKLYDKIIKK